MRHVRNNVKEKKLIKYMLYNILYTVSTQQYQ